MLHASISVVWPVQVPPCSSFTNFVRVFVLVPVPHVWEHSPRTQSFHSQWMANSIEYNMHMDKLIEQRVFILVPIFPLILKHQLTWTTLCITRLLHGCFANTNSSMSRFFSFCSCVGSGSSIAGLWTFTNLPIVPFTILGENFNFRWN